LGVPCKQAPVVVSSLRAAAIDELLALFIIPNTPIRLVRIWNAISFPGGIQPQPLGHGGKIRHDGAVFCTHSADKIFDDWIYEGKVPTGEVVREGALQLNSEGYVRRYLAWSGLEKRIAAKNGAIGLTDTS
jgi:hypothetical protein